MEENKALILRIAELERQIALITKEKDKFKAIVDADKLRLINRDYKDRLFKFIFGNSENKGWTLSLYNAINGTDYDNPDDISFNTIEDAVYMGMKNDISFIVSSVMNLWEHQSSPNPNMPMRFFIYGGELYDKYTATSEYNKYSSKLQQIPAPKCVCFYNGTQDQPDSWVHKLSDAYDEDGDIEVRVNMININSDKNPGLMKSCKPLYEYAWTVESVRRLQNEKMNLDAAVDKTIDDMPDDFMIKSFLVANRAEVKQMFLTEYNEEKMLELEGKEKYEEGLIDAKVEAVFKLMKKKGFALKDALSTLDISIDEWTKYTT